MSTAPLGQNLFREALTAGTLEPFAEAARGMEDPQATLLERANAFKAVRFGLSGLAIHGWQESITQPTAQPFGDTTLEYKFVATPHFPSHDKTLVGVREGIDIWDHAVDKTQGETALKTIALGLRSSAQAYLSKGRTIEGIRLNDIFGAIRTYVLRGRELGLDEVPDAFDKGQPFFEDFFQTRGKTEDTVDIVRSLSQTAANPIRFTSRPLGVLMKHYAPIYSRDDLRCAPHPAELRDISYNQKEVANTLAQTTRYIIRASQRRDGTLTTADVASETSNRLPVFVNVDSQGNKEVWWPTKHMPPTPQAPPGDTPPSADHYSNTRRNKCPIGYTPDAFTPMPVEKIADAIIYYLFENGLHDPLEFMMPKSLL